MKDIMFRLIDRNLIVGYEQYMHFNDRIDWLYAETDNGVWGHDYPYHDHKEQFTGMKDKTGQNVYEGDIFDMGMGWIDVIKWNEEKAAFGQWCPSKDKWDFHTLDGSIPDQKIVGNIHDNPELIK